MFSITYLARSVMFLNQTSLQKVTQVKDLLFLKRIDICSYTMKEIFKTK